MVEHRKKVRQAHNALKLKTGAIFDGPDNQRFQTADDGQALFNTVAAFKYRIVVDHKTVSRYVDDMDRLVTVRLTFGQHLVVRPVAGGAA